MCITGNGKEALYKLHINFTETSGMAVSMRTQALMSPSIAKHEWEINDVLEKFLKNVYHVDAICPNGAILPVMFKLRAVLRILCGSVADNHDTATNAKVTTDEEFKASINRIKEDARKKKLEQNG